MTEVAEFVNILFEKSKYLNDLNTQFLSELMLGELNHGQKLDLFYKSTQYHENILQTIKSIVKDLDKTSVLLTQEQSELIKYTENLEDFERKLLLDLVSAVKDTVLVPKNLSVCPFCGKKLLFDSDNNKACKKVPLKISDKIYGYSINCINKGENNESE